jgi:hypothetical protein
VHMIKPSLTLHHFIVTGTYEGSANVQRCIHRGYKVSQSPLPVLRSIRLNSHGQTFFWLAGGGQLAAPLLYQRDTMGSAGIRRSSNSGLSALPKNTFQGLGLLPLPRLAQATQQIPYDGVLTFSVYMPEVYSVNDTQ